MYRESSFIVTSTSIVLSDQSFWYSQQTRKHSSLLYLALFLNDFIVEWHRGSQVYIFSRPLSWTPHLGILLFSSLPHILHLIHQERATLKSYLGSNRFSPPPLLPAKSQPPMFLVWIILVLHLHPPPTRSLPAFSSCPITVYSQQPGWSYWDMYCGLLPAQTLAVTPRIIEYKPKSLLCLQRPYSIWLSYSHPLYLTLFFLLFTLASSSQTGHLAVPQTR